MSIWELEFVELYTRSHSIIYLVFWGFSLNASFMNPPIEHHLSWFLCHIRIHYLIMRAEIASFVGRFAYFCFGSLSFFLFILVLPASHHICVITIDCIWLTTTTTKKRTKPQQHKVKSTKISICNANYIIKKLSINGLKSLGISTVNWNTNTKYNCCYFSRPYQCPDYTKIQYISLFIYFPHIRLIWTEWDVHYCFQHKSHTSFVSFQLLI